ncbi:MAG: hypothetical protein NTV32_05405 [Gammaproteobacteria bacterium]|nr:hypothetical protein [Gammaproteobacteria bacterium]
MMHTSLEGQLADLRKEVNLLLTSAIDIRKNYFQAIHLMNGLNTLSLKIHGDHAKTREIFDLTSLILKFKKAPIDLLTRAADLYFWTVLTRPGGRLETQISPKTDGNQIGAVMTFTDHEGMQMQSIRYFVKYHGSKKDYKNHLPVDLKELFVYKLLEYLGKGPKMHAFCSPELPGECIIATQDLSHSKRGREKNLRLFDDFLDEHPSLAPQPPFEARVTLELEVLSMLLSIIDTHENPANYGQMETDQGKKWKVFDFLMSPSIMYDIARDSTIEKMHWFLSASLKKNPRQALRTTLHFLQSLKKGPKKLSFDAAVDRALQEILAFAHAEYRGLGIALPEETVPGGDHRYRLDWATHALTGYAALIKSRMTGFLQAAQTKFLESVSEWADYFSAADSESLFPEQCLLFQSDQRETLFLLIRSLPGLSKERVPYVGATIQQILMSLSESLNEDDASHLYYDTSRALYDIDLDWGDSGLMRFRARWLDPAHSPMRDTVRTFLRKKCDDRPIRHFAFYPKTIGGEVGLRVKIEFIYSTLPLQFYVKTHVKKRKKADLDLNALLAYKALAYFGLGPKVDFAAYIAPPLEEAPWDDTKPADRSKLYLLSQDLGYSRDPYVRKSFTTLAASPKIEELSEPLKGNVFLLYIVATHILGLGDLQSNNLGFVQVEREGLPAVSKFKICDFLVNCSWGGSVTRESLCGKWGAFTTLRAFDEYSSASVFEKIVQEDGPRLLPQALDCLENGIPSTKNPAKRGPSFREALNHAHRDVIAFFISPARGDPSHPNAYELLYQSMEMTIDCQLTGYYKQAHLFLNQALSLQEAAASTFE